MASVILEQLLMLFLIDYILVSKNEIEHKQLEDTDMTIMLADKTLRVHMGVQKNVPITIGPYTYGKYYISSSDGKLIVGPIGRRPSCLKRTALHRLCFSRQFLPLTTQPLSRFYSGPVTIVHAASPS
jgi:hypothetical protein